MTLCEHPGCLLGRLGRSDARKNENTTIRQKLSGNLRFWAVGAVSGGLSEPLQHVRHASGAVWGQWNTISERFRRFQSAPDPLLMNAIELETGKDQKLRVLDNCVIEAVPCTAHDPLDSTPVRKADSLLWRQQTRRAHVDCDMAAAEQEMRCTPQLECVAWR